MTHQSAQWTILTKMYQNLWKIPLALKCLIIIYQSVANNFYGFLGNWPDAETFSAMFRLKPVDYLINCLAYINYIKIYGSYSYNFLFNSLKFCF